MDCRYPDPMSLVENSIAKKVLYGETSATQAAGATESLIMDIVNRYN